MLPAIFFPGALTLLLLIRGPFLVSGLSVLVRGQQAHLRLSRTQFFNSKGGVSGGGGWSSQADLDNYADQMNPTNDNYDGGKEGDYEYYTQTDLNKHADQMNPNNDNYDGGKEGDFEYYTQTDLNGGEYDYYADLGNHADHQM